MPRVESISTCVVRVVLDVPAHLSNRNITAREYGLVRVRSTDGAEGFGYSYAVNTGGSVIEHAVVDLLAPCVLGQESLRVEGLWQDMYQEALLLGRAGGVMRALSALDIALWDLNARTVGLPLYRYLGAAVDDRVAAYASGGYHRQDQTPQHLAEELGGFVDDGYRAVKMRIGRSSPADDEARVRAAREAIGPDVHLMLDANNAWRDLPSALGHLRRLERFDPYWIEEPFSPDDIGSHAELARMTPVAVATGEIEAGRWRFKQLLDQRAAAILQADATVCGGVTEWRRIAATAASYGVPMAPHAWHNVHVHLVASTPNALYVEHMPDDRILGFRRLIDQDVDVEGEWMRLPSRAGLGFGFDGQAIRRHSNHADDGWLEVR